MVEEKINTVKRLYGSMITILVTAGALATGTWMFYSDIESADDNLISAGTINLRVNNFSDFSASVPFSFSNLKPGDGVPQWLQDGQFDLHNSGNVTATEVSLSVDPAQMEIMENDCTEPEIEGGDLSCGSPGLGEGELADYLFVRLSLSPNCPDGPSTITTSKLLLIGTKDITSKLSDGKLDPNETETVYLCHRLPASVGNVIMGDSVNFQISFIAKQ